jgi:hypothetical protein
VLTEEVAEFKTTWPAVCCARKHSYLAAQYQRLRGRRGHNKAVTAGSDTHERICSLPPCRGRGVFASRRKRDGKLLVPAGDALQRV